MARSVPWHRPGQWRVNPMYWESEALAERAGMPPEVHLIDSTLTEGDDCVGHQLNWNTRLELNAAAGRGRHGGDHAAEPYHLR